MTVAALLVAVTGLGLAAWRALSAGATEATVAITSAPSISAAPPPPPVADTAPPASATAAPEPTMPVAPTAAPRPKAPSAHAPAVMQPAPSVPPRPLEDTGLPTTGMLAIRGPGSVGAEIRVDGASRGLAPKSLSLPVGTHSVVLVLADGTRLGPRSMVVTVRNTRSMPAAWDVAAR
jgi:outer membrane biosynthesis protein TonB